MKNLAAILALSVAACTSMPSPEERQGQADALASAHGWRPELLRTPVRDLQAYIPADTRTATELTIYIEGDGLAWLSSSRPSDNPTPRDPLALRLALAQPGGTAAYLGRACQYRAAGTRNCPQRYWTHARFAPELIDASNDAVDQLKQRFGARSLRLVGYSGGGAIAALLAARRLDVTRLVTVAGNLDHEAWTRHHGVDPLRGSDNPVAVTRQLALTRQWHLSGGKDRIIPPWLAESFARRFDTAHQPAIRVFPEFDHQCCWVEYWPSILRSISE